MSSTAAKEKTAYEKWLDLPENVVGEIIRGNLYVNPRPASKHAIVSSSIGGELMGPFHKGKNGGPGGWWILDEPEIRLENNITVPDLAGWRRDRMPEFPDVAFFTLAPDWICEVLSPGTEALDRAKKMPFYAQQGVSHLWLVDPIEKTLEVYENDHINWKLLRTYANDDKVRAAPFDAIEIDLAALWS